MCLNNSLKTKIIVTIDKCNGNLIDFFDKVDTKCTALGNFIIRKYNYYFEQTRYTRAYSKEPPLSPDDYDKISIIITDVDGTSSGVELVDKQEEIDTAWDVLNYIN
jgi:hypothetical protein